MWSVVNTVFKQRFSADLFELSDTKYIDSKSSLTEYMYYYLAKMEFCFVWIKRLLLGFCSNQCSISVVKFSKTHTMVVHFLGCSGPKRKKTENTTALELWRFRQSLSLKVWFFSSFIFFDVACCVPSAHKLLTSSASLQIKHLYCLISIGGVSSILLVLYRLFTLASFFLSSSLFLFSKDLFNSADNLRCSCDSRLHCPLWIFRVLSVH